MFVSVTFKKKRLMIKNIKNITNKALSALVPTIWKTQSELMYWKKRKKEEGELSNQHYPFFYTSHFDFKATDYHNKRILDIGCGPRGSLEWARGASERVGLDPLAHKYLKMGADKHQMQYISSGSENIPFQDSYFDFTCSFNSLDHVENVEETIHEIKRVTKPNGYFLLLVEINHEPTNCEPHEIKPDIIGKFEPEFRCDLLRVYDGKKGGVYDSIHLSEPVNNPHSFQKPGWLSSKFTRL